MGILILKKRKKRWREAGSACAPSSAHSEPRERFGRARRHDTNAWFPSMALLSRWTRLLFCLGTTQGLSLCVRGCSGLGVQVQIIRVFAQRSWPEQSETCGIRGRQTVT